MALKILCNNNLFNDKGIRIYSTKFETWLEGESKQQKAKDKEKQIGKSKKPKKPVVDQFQRQKIKLGSRVKLIATKQIGNVEEISKDTVVVTFGFARMKVDRDNSPVYQGGVVNALPIPSDKISQ